MTPLWTNQWGQADGVPRVGPFQVTDPGVSAWQCTGRAGSLQAVNDVTPDKPVDHGYDIVVHINTVDDDIVDGILEAVNCALLEWIAEDFLRRPSSLINLYLQKRLG